MFTLTHVFGKALSLDKRYPECMKFTKTALIVIDTAIAIGLLVMGIFAAYSAAGGNLGALNLLCSLSPTYASVMVLTSFIPLCINNIAFACIFHFSSKQQTNILDKAKRSVEEKGDNPDPSLTTPSHTPRQRSPRSGFSSSELNEFRLPSPPTPYTGPPLHYSPAPPPPPFPRNSGNH